MSAQVSVAPPILPGGLEACRLTIAGPGGSADLAVPVTVTIAELQAVLWRYQPAPTADVSPWVLQRLGEPPLDPAATVQSAGLRSGEVLHLRPAAAALPALDFDDVADGVARTVRERRDRWTPELARRVSLVLAGALLAAAGIALPVVGDGPVPTVGATLLAVVCGAACVPLQAPAARSARRLVATAAILFGALAGFTAVGGTGHAAVTAAAAGGGFVALALGTAGGLPAVLPATGLAVAAVVGAAAAVAGLRGGDPAGSTAAIAVVTLLLGLVAPRVALRAGRLRVAPLPRDAQELQQGIDPEPEDRVRRGVRRAEAVLGAYAVATATIVTAAAILLGRAPGWAPPTLAVLLGGALLLRARGQYLAGQRIPSLLGGAAAPVAVVVTAGNSWLGPVAAVTILAAAAGVLLAWSQRASAARVLPLWPRLGEIAEPILVLGLVPVLAQVLHLYAYLRANA